jgi:hypothetical protein
MAALSTFTAGAAISTLETGMGSSHCHSTPLKNRGMDQQKFIQAYLLAVAGTVLVGAIALLIYG